MCSPAFYSHFPVPVLWMSYFYESSLLLNVRWHETLGCIINTCCGTTG